MGITCLRNCLHVIRRGAYSLDENYYRLSIALTRKDAYSMRMQLLAWLSDTAVLGWAVKALPIPLSHETADVIIKRWE